MRFHPLFFHLFFLLLVILFSSCTTYYQKSIVFQEEFVSGDMAKANSILDGNKKAELGKDRLLYFLQKGVVLQYLEDYAGSNLYLEKAYTFVEDFRSNIGNELGSLLTNPMAKPYIGEDHEVVLIHYYKAINYLLMNDVDASIVECRRLNNKLQALNDKYDKKKNRYKVDAFALNLMGICYEASGDFNNAFIAYKNSVLAYEDFYTKNFSTTIPTQLKKDVIRMAFVNGFDDERARFEGKFKLKYEASESSNGDLILFVNNGLGPVKDEWSINFFIVKGQGGLITFVNEEMGLTFPFQTASNEEKIALGDLKTVRVAFPKYLERKPYYRSVMASIENKKYPLEVAENINDIAISALQDRMERELANALLRLALKQSAEQVVSSKNANVGALLSVFDAISEKSDTRNWQTLPYTISYARIPLNTDNNIVELEFLSPQKSRSKLVPLKYFGMANKTIFGLYTILESLPLTNL